MKKIVTCILCLFLFGCANKPLEGTYIVPEQYKSRKLSACLPEALELMQRLRNVGIEANVVLYRYRLFDNPNKYNSHAILVYFAPPGANQLWGWDANFGSVRLIAYRDNASQIARAWIKSIGQNTETIITNAQFLESNWK